MGVWGQVTGRLHVVVYEPRSDEEQPGKKRFYDSSMIINYINTVIQSYKNALYYGDDPIETIERLKNTEENLPYYMVDPFNYQSESRCSIPHCVNEATPVWDGRFVWSVIPTNYESCSKVAMEDGLFHAEDINDLTVNQSLKFSYVNGYDITFDIMERNLFGDTLAQLVYNLINYLKETKDLTIDVGYQFIMRNSRIDDNPVLCTDDQYLNDIRVQYIEHKSVFDNM